MSQEPLLPQESQQEKHLHVARQRLEILYALGIQENGSQQSDECPDEEAIAAYFDGFQQGGSLNNSALSQMEQQQFLEKLAHCPDSYRQWLNLAEALELTLPLADKETRSKQWGWDEMMSKLKSWFDFPQWAIASAMTMGLLMVVVYLSPTPWSEKSLEQQLTQGYDDFSQLEFAVVDVSKYINKGYSKSYPKKRNSMTSQVPFREKEAFASGFKQGIQQILLPRVSDPEQYKKTLSALPDKPLPCKASDRSCENQTQLEQQIGRWSLLMINVCSNIEKPSAHFWQSQKELISKFVIVYQMLQKKGKARHSLAKRVLAIGDTFEQNHMKGTQEKQLACKQIKELSYYVLQR